MSGRFFAAMRFIEEERQFPVRPEHVHGERFAALLEIARLVQPLAAIPAVVVAGSAGKASTARMVASIARAALDRVGDRRPIVLGTKPPLHETFDGHRERYQILRAGLTLPEDTTELASAWAQACWIDRHAFADHVDSLRTTAAQLEARQGVALAPYDLRYAVLARVAAGERAALVVVEANIGLVNDPARRWPGQRVNVLARIDADHVGLLAAPAAFSRRYPELGRVVGPLWQKAAGVAPGSTVVVAPQAADVELVSRVVALKAGARVVTAVRERCTVSRVRMSLDGTRAALVLDGKPLDVRLSAIGEYQVDNARTAAVTCRELARLGVLPELTTATLRQGLRRVIVPGRLELLARAPTTLLNVTEGAAKLRGLLSSLRGLGIGRWVACASVVARVADAADIVDALAGAPETATFIATAHAKDDVPATQLASWAAAPGRHVTIEPEAAVAVAQARALAGEKGTVLLVGNGVAHALERPVARFIAAAASATGEETK